MDKQNMIEKRLGVVISPKIKQIWEVQMKLLKRFSELCNEHDLKWWLHGSSLAGAVLTQGFLPHDLYVTVGMRRDDFERLIKNVKLEPPFVLQSEHNESCVGSLYAKLRNSVTTYINKDEIDTPFTYNKGMFMNIVPFDDVNADIQFPKEVLDGYVNALKLKSDVTFMNMQGLLTIGKYREASQIVHDNVMRFIEQCKKYKGCEEIADFSAFISNKISLSKTYFEHLTTVQFEGMDVYVPCNTLYILDKMYGNKWREHFMRSYYNDIFLIDVHTPYKVTLNKFQNTITNFR